MNFYTNFTTGLIDGILFRQSENEYSILENNKRIRNNVLKRNQFGQQRTGDLTQPIDTYLREYLLKQELKPVSDFNYEYEHPTPFDNKINKSLLIFKWIIGIQQIKGIAEITREDLKEIDLDMSLSTLQKILFMFNKSIVTNSLNDGTLTIIVGSRDLKTGYGPGYINLRVSIPYLMDKIKAHHNKLKEELLA